MGEDQERIEAYLRWREESTSTRIERSRFGTALFDDDFPSYWDGNILRVDRPVVVSVALEIPGGGLPSATIRSPCP